MGKVVKTQYMDKAQRGYSEYFFYDDEARETISPVPGDRGFMKDGSMWFCWETGKWEELIDKAKSGNSVSIDANGIVTFGGSATVDENGIVSL